MLMTRTLLALSLITSLAIGCGGDEPGTHVDDPDTTIIDDDAGPDAEDPDADTDDTDVEDPDTDVDPVDEFGALSITVAGLPDGSWPELTLSGDEGDIIIGEGGLIEDLAAGEYELSAAPFTLELAIFEAAPVELTIEADRTTEVILNFALILASLNVIIEKLPPGVDASVDMIG